MKKTLLLAVAAFSLAACTNQTDLLFEPTPQEVKIKPVTQKTSRAALTGQALPTEMEVYVFATQKNATTYEKWFEDALFKCNGSTENANWSGGYTFNLDFTDFEFMAYTCDMGADQKKPQATFTIEGTTKQITSLELDFTNNALTGSNDIMVTDLVKGQKTGTAFAMQFHHALSWVFVNFLSDSSNGNDLLIKDVEIKEVPLNGKLTITPNYTSLTSGADLCTETWTPIGDVVDVPFPAYVPASGSGVDYLTLGQAADKHAQGLMILPTDRTAITFKYKSKEGSGYSAEWKDFTISLSDGTPTPKWEAGKRYEYRISIKTNEILVNPKVTDWDPQSDHETTL